MRNASVSDLYAYKKVKKIVCNSSTPKKRAKRKQHYNRMTPAIKKKKKCLVHCNRYCYTENYIYDYLPFYEISMEMLKCCAHTRLTLFFFLLSTCCFAVKFVLEIAKKIKIALPFITFVYVCKCVRFFW